MRKFTLLMAFLATTMLSLGADMSGTYTVGTGGTYATLGAAVTDLNAATITGNVVLEIISDLTEPTNIGLCKDFGNYSLIIRPDQDVDRIITFTQAGDNGASSGNFIIGLSNIALWSSIGTSKNITIDGFANGGSTRRLTFQNQSTNNNACKPIMVLGSTDNINIKNCILLDKTTGSSAFGAFTIRVRVESSVDYIPNNITVDNCILSSVSSTAAGIAITNSNTPTGRSVGLVFKNNKIEVKHRGISLNYSGTCSIYNNEIKVNQTTSGMASFGIGGTSSGLVLTNIYNNRIIQLGTANTAGGGNGIRGIQASGGGTWNIYNNFITGFSTPTTGTTEALGIRVGSASNIYNNTILINNITTTGAGTTPTACIVNYSTTCNLANNILITQEDDIASYCIYQSGTLTSSDYNLLYRNGTTNAKIGYAAGAPQATLVDWQTASTKDKNSKSVDVLFTNAATGDLHLTGASVNDVNLATPLQATVTNDIDGTVRTAITYKGAHQASDMTAVAKQFTVTVPNGTEKVYIAGDFTGKSWDNTDPLQLTAQTTANVFSGIFPCVDGVNYKYLCEKGDWEYQDASSVDPLTEKGNRTYNANDVVDFWKAMPKVTLNVSFASGQGIPANLFVKGSWNAWATPIELTKSGDTYSGFLGGNPGDKIYSNTEYKYYTNDITTDNWEVFSGNRWSIYPTMTDVIASFTTPLPATGIIPATEMDVRIMRTQSGITAEFDGSANVELYSINGAMIDKTVAYGSYTRDLNPGAYIIRINGKATKFIR